MVDHLDLKKLSSNELMERLKTIQSKMDGISANNPQAVELMLFMKNLIIQELSERNTYDAIKAEAGSIIGTKDGTINLTEDPLAAEEEKKKNETKPKK
jgi:hypothetical protein